MHIESSRFGRMEIDDDAVLHFPDGLIGLAGTRWALVCQNETSAFFWLHSVDDATLALPVTMPGVFFSDYEIELSDEDTRRLQLQASDDAEVFCVVRASSRLEEFTANLRGPIVVNTSRRLGRQIINEDTPYGVREPLFHAVDLDDAPAVETDAPMAASGF